MWNTIEHQLGGVGLAELVVHAKVKMDRMWIGDLFFGNEITMRDG